jgi:hypothetical protein
MTVILYVQNISEQLILILNGKILKGTYKLSWNMKKERCLVCFLFMPFLLFFCYGPFIIFPFILISYDFSTLLPTYKTFQKLRL